MGGGEEAGGEGWGRGRGGGGDGGREGERGRKNVSLHGPPKPSSLSHKLLSSSSQAAPSVC